VSFINERIPENRSFIALNALNVFFFFTFAKKTMCTFTVPFSENVNKMIENVKRSVAKMEKASFDGSESKGTFSFPSPLGIVKASYTIVDSKATFNVQEKPMLVRCSMIETKLFQLLNPNN
jgi:hypothetical protein